MPAPNEILVKQLNRLIGTPRAPEIVDVCIDDDFLADPYLIPGSWRHSHNRLEDLAAKLHQKRAVIVCQKGKKLSQGVTAYLNSEGIEAQYLSGGIYAWRDAPDTARIPAQARPAGPLWVTRHRPKIDRIACPWLIRRFVDREARFLFVEPGAVFDVAERFSATPFDIEGADFSHIGERCSFDRMLDVFTLHSDALDRMARVIRGADTNRHDLHPAAAGLLAVSVGLSRQYKNDQDQLNVGFALYDALYAWVRDGYEEGHDWPTGAETAR